MTKSRLLLHFVVLLLLSIQPANSTELRISNILDGIPGSTRSFSISVDSVDSEIDRFSFLLALNQKDYGFISATPSQDIIDCGWEYFNYRLLPKDSIQQYDIGNNTDLLLVTAFKGNSGFDFPSCGNRGLGGNLFDLRVKFINETYLRPVRCTAMPVRFYWRDCNDNVLYSSNNDTINIVSTLYDNFYDTVASTFAFPGFGPPDIECNSPGNEIYKSIITATNGLVDFPCTDTVGNLVGDINLNGIANEAADVMRYIRYFIDGIGIFCWGITNCIPDAVIAQSDVNKDNIMLTVADLVFQIRIILGDVDPRLKLSPSAEYFTGNAVYMNLNEIGSSTIIEIESDINISAVYLRMVNDDNEEFEISKIVITEHEFQFGNIGKEATALLIDMFDNLVLEKGRHRLLELEGTGYAITHVEIVDELANSLRVITNEKPMPTEFTLAQNYPNPFNPSTSIQFFIPVQSDWQLTIYNLSGQVVRQFYGNSIGSVTVDWNGTDYLGRRVASAIYLYSLETDYFSDSKKMMLLK